MPTAAPSRTDVVPLPFGEFRDLPAAALEDRIAAVKASLGDSLLILGHHYQQDEVIRLVREF